MIATISSIQHKERNYESAQYLLPSDGPEEQRLNTQHRLIKRSFDGRLYIAPIELKDGDRVLESGAGTGKWMLEFASEVSDKVQIEGIDIASRLFPRKYPANVAFSTNSITSLPPAWDSRFVYVHQRLLTGALTKNMWKSAISEIFRVLQPGGLVELLEVGRVPQSGPYSSKMESIMKALFRYTELMYNREHELPMILTEAGFISVQVDRHAIPMGHSAGQYGVDGNKNLRNALYGVKTPVLKAGGFGFVSTEEEYDEAVVKMSKEWGENNAEMEMFTFVARKPML